MNKGFSIIELLISVSILIFINTLILTSYPKFIEMVNLSQASQMVVSSVRRAQVYGMTIKEVGVDEFPSYGIYFEKSFPYEYKLFADTYPLPNGDNLYNPFVDLLVEIYSVPASIYIDRIYDQYGSDLDDLNIIFRRPMPIIFLFSEGGTRGPFDYAKIVLKSPRGREKNIVIWKTGQISVESVEVE